MAHFKELENILNTTISMVLNNQTLCKLLYYYPQDVDYSFSPESMEDIEDTSILLLNNVFPLPKQPDATTDQKCLLDVNVSKMKSIVGNKYAEVSLTFDIICHLDSWLIKNGFRPLRILFEIDKMFNDQITNLNIVNKPQINNIVPKMYANKFFGYQIEYKIQLNSNMECF